jgi:hypothetical protein
MAYRKQITTCGVEGHDEECLCDVIITKPTKVTVTIPDSFQYGHEVVEYLGLGVPWKAADLALFLETHQKLVAAIKAEKYKNVIESSRKIGELNRKLNDEQFVFLKGLINQGMMPTPAITIIKEKYGISIHRSYVNKLKHKMIAKGEYNAD